MTDCFFDDDDHDKVMAGSTLPPFGIRGLCSPDKPFSVVQLSELQYDASLHSYPGSALMWLDEDDGELVTVGSGSELRDRLNDPIPLTNPLIKVHTKRNGRAKDQYIHLFDISDSPTSLDVWREHEAYYSKTQSQVARSPVSSPEPEKSEEKQIEQDEHVPESQVAKQEASQEIEEVVNSHNTVLDLPSHNTVPGLFEGLGFQLNHLAGFLQGTSESLRRAAEKTRECDTSPIEDVLSGMTTILGEVGAFGLDVIEKLNETPAETRTPATADSSISTTCPEQTQDASCSFFQTTDEYFTKLALLTGQPIAGSTSTEERIRHACNQLLEDDGRVFDTSLLDEIDKNNRSFSNITGHEARDLERSVLVQLLALNRLETSEAEAKELAQPYSTTILDEVERLQIRKSLYQALFDMNSISSTSLSIDLPKPNQTANVTLSSDSSLSRQIPILDQDTDAIDAAFSARYPPLMSLRKAKTFDVLRPEPGHEMWPRRAGSIKQNQTGPPRPQVFDAETQRRRDFAKTCFPAQEYTPGSGPTLLTLARPKCTVPVTVEEIVQPATDTSDSFNVQAKDFAEESALDTSAVADNASSIASVDTDIQTIGSTTNELPGTWHPVVEKNHSQHTAFDDTLGNFIQREVSFNRGTEHNAPGFAQPLHGHHRLQRLQRHRSLINPITKQPPTDSLHRAQSVTASNPFARLNGPFSPLFPTPVTPKSFLEPEPTLPKTNGGPVRSLHRSMSDRRPKSLYEPYRPSNAHRTFEPVWEGQDELGKYSDPNPGVVIVDASNFEPGTTEQDIRDLLADDCRTVIGINTLISCRIVATEPQVVAKLVIKDKTNADTVIDKYNRKWTNGRPLRFEYARTGIDARINRIRGALPPPEVSRPRHLRSVPDLRKPDEPKPSRVAPATQAKPIVPPPPPLTFANVAKASMPPTPLPSQPVLPPAFAGNLIHDCENQLMAMGYGQMDPTLLSRLQVYACAANGDVHEAIEMIEDDRKANDFDAFEKKIESAREERWGEAANEESDDPDSYEQDLEKAIKASMQEQ